jgi:hypothetical protein
VPPPPPQERLADRHDVTLVLRLLVDRQGALVQGEVGGLDDDVEHWVRFRGADGLLRAVRAWLAARPAGRRDARSSDA